MTRRVQHEELEDVSPIYENERVGLFRCTECGKIRILGIQGSNRGHCSGTSRGHRPRQVEWTPIDTLQKIRVYGDDADIEKGHQLGIAGEYFDE